MRSAVRRLAKVLPSVVLGAALALTAVVPAAKAAPADGAPSWPEGQKTTVVDPSTITTWEGVAHEDTENVGRIWTDKTVSNDDVRLPGGIESVIEKGDSDFLVGLSALSSTSNTTTTSSRPLDIVLVLDVSGSMDDGLGGGFVYSPTYAVSENFIAPTYYAKTEDGQYQKIDRISKGFTGILFDHWELNGKEVLPKTSEEDSADGRIQFYQRTYETMSKIEGLKGAADQFITATAEKNGDIADKARQHRISIVKFAGEMRNTIGNNGSGGKNYTQVVSDLTAYTPDTVSEATRIIDTLRTGGATSADYGMLQAQAVLNGRKAGNRVDKLVGAREGAQKVVIFFTDGQPTHSNGFQDTVANNAIKTARAMKDDGALVYSVGVFADANPGDTMDTFNAYMHGVSSNYPDATAYNRLGSRAENSNYYKAATDADELNGIFQEISDEINKGTGLPTHTTEGMANKSGYITFTDELGAYMRVDGFKSLIFADKVFDPQSKTSNGLIDTYTYEGTGGNALYPNGNVKDIVVQVQRSEELAKGDIVTVKIPASLIPLRNFKVTTTEAGSTMEIGKAYPLRIFYGVSIKPEVHAAVMSGTADQALRDYIAGNTADGKTNFYSNFYDGRVIVEDGKRLGNTTASFEPSDANSFYYFTEDTPLYTDRECKIPLTKEPTAGEEYFYKRSYYKKGSAGQAEKAESIIKFRGVNFNRPEPYWSQAADGSYFIKKGAPRLTRVDSLTLTKESNVTGTATEVINPRWDNVDNPHMVNVSLGNNGKLSVDMPGSLAINKDARIAPNKNIDPKVLDGKSFEFEITIPSAAGKTLTAEVRNAQNERIGEPFDMKFENGKRRQSLKDEETLYIHGLDAGADYTVTEVKDKMPGGFKQTSAEGDTGKIAAGKTQAVKFVNTYDVAAVAVDAADLGGYQKIFARWDIAKTFDIELKASQADNPMPKGSTPGADGLGSKVVEVTEANQTGDFGSISFDRPGTFEYTVREVAPSAEGVIPGMTYSNASYTIRVDVADDGKGGLTATSAMTRTNNDAGVGVSEPIENKVAVFTNSFNARETSAGPEAVKVYTNKGGSETAMKDGKFTFKVKPLTDGAPVPAGMEIQPDGYIHVKNSGSNVVFGQAVYGEGQVGWTYEYEISELIPEGADAGNGYTLNGMTYDPSVYIAAFAVSVDESATVKVSISYYKMVDGKPEQLPEGQIPEFANVYDPKDVTLPGDAASPLKARKTLKGRDAKDGEAFEFTLVADNNAAVAALEHDDIVFGDDNAATELKASVTGLKNGVPADAPFGSVKFTKPGTYTFDISESVPEKDGAGMTYDRGHQKVTVVVTDKNGVLEAKVSYTGAATDAAAFTNTYRSSLTYGDAFSLDVTKTLTGRAQKAGEFGFAIVGADKDATDRLAESDKSFTTIAPAKQDVATKMPGKLADLRFTQADAGKTFTYTLSEVVPDKKLGGVTYDQTTYKIAIQVVDNADGTMKTITTVSKNGGDPVGTYDSSDGRDVVTLGFKNAYKAAPVEVSPDTADLGLYKVLKGRDWLATDSFHFTMKSAVPSQPESAVAEKDVAAPGAQEGDKVPFSFGSYTFDAPGTYYYAVDETPGNIPGISYDGHSARVVVDVTDNLEGKLVANIKVIKGVFTNTYEAELAHDAAGGLIIAKTTKGHDMAEGQFKFQVQARDGKGTTAAETAKRIGIGQGTADTFGNVAGKDGVRVEMKSPAPIKFTQADAGKSFVFTVSEMGADGKPGTGGKKDGYTYSDAVYTIELSVADNLDGTLTLTTKVTDKDNKTTITESTAATPLATTIDFVNSYAAATTDATDVDLATAATKTLDGRNMKAGEFSFEIVSNPIAEQGAEKKIATGENAAADSGKPAAVTFKPASIGYNLKDLKAAAADTTADRYVDAGTTNDGKPQYTVRYTARELTGDLPQAGVTAVKASFDFTVTVIDNGDGTLAATANYPKGGLAFTNTYSWQPVVVDPDAIQDAAVTKVLKGNRGTGLADGEFTFQMATEATAGSLDTVKDADGKAWPATKTAANKADGSVDFGEMSFSAAGTYKVTIKEVKGDAAHMTYDAHEFTYTIEVTYDPATGKLSAKVEGLDPAKATFTNVYFDAKDAKDVVISGADKPQASVDGKLVGVGDELTYTIDWVNNAVDESGVPVEADIAVVDKIPHGTEFVSASKDGVHSNGTVTWKLGKQPAGASGTVALTVRVTDDAVVTGSVENQASIQIGGNKVTTNVTETFVPGKSETTHPDSVKPGETVLTYQIKFHNADGAGATAMVVDKLGKGLEYQVGSALVNGKPAEPVVEGSTSVGTTLTWNLTDLVADRDVIITFNVKVAENGPNTVDNQAVVNGHVSNVETTPFPTKDAKHVYNKDDILFDGKLVGVGETLTFKIDWWHDATLDNGNPTVTVVDKLPDGMGPKDGTISDNGRYDAEKGTITWTIEDAAGKHGTVSFQAEVTDAVIEAAKRGEVTNIAKVNNHASQSVSVSVPTKTVAKPEGQSGSIKVGDEVVYTINYKNTEAAAAVVTITDKLPSGITYKADSAAPAASYDEANRTLTWTLADVAPGESGSVSFTGVVNESAIEGGVDNKAGIQLGENGPVISTNTESTKMGTGDLTISKHVKSAIADVTAPTAEFTFDVTLTDATGKQLAGTYNYEGDKKGVIENGAGQIKLAHGQSITIKGLPEGAEYAVVEHKVDGFTAIADTMNGAIAKNQTAQAAFTNTYRPAPIVIPGGVDSALQVKKVLKGRDWLPNESYSFELQAVTVGAPMPEGVGNVATATADNQPASFGGISFAKPGEYEYRIVETGASADVNLTFSKAEYKLVVTVEANGSVLQATFVLTQVKDDAGKTVDEVLQVPGEVMTFTNTYKKPAQGKDVTAEGKPGTSIDGQLVQVGSKLVYTINWVNDAVDEIGKAVPAAVTITDVIPAGTAYVKDSATNGGVYNADTKTLTWDLGKQEANASGTVSFTVEVTEDALNNSVVNEADIQIGDNKHETTSKPEVFVPGKTSADDNKGDIQVGDVLTYTVSYANLGNESATVTITDVLPSGLTYKKDSANPGASYDGVNTLTWTIKDVPANTKGVVTFEARVNEDAVQNGIGNKATVQIGNNKVETNTTDPDTKPAVGTLTVSKTVKAANDPSAPVDIEKVFDFKVNLKDKAGNTLTGDYAYTIGEKKGTLGSGATFSLKHGQSIVIDGLPVGATYEVREKPTDGYTATAEGDTGAITKENPNAAATFTNTYSAALPQGSQVTTANLFTKVLAGRDWKADDSFTFTIAPLNGAPAPEHLEATLTGLTTAADKPVKFGFGAISFTFDHIKDAPVVNGERTKTFVYEVRETEGSIPGVAYDGHVAKLTVTLKDNGEGVLSATTVVDNEAQFTNEYKTKPVNPDGDGAAGKDGIQIVKTLTGRPIAAGDFEFAMAPADDATKAKFGDAKVIATNAAELGIGELANTAIATTPVKTGLEFTLEDVGKTYTFELSETKGGGDGYVNDQTVHALTFTTADNGNGTLSVTVTLDDKEAAVWTSGAEITPVSIGFANSYRAGSITVGGQGGVALAGTKQLTGRPMVAGEFHFNVTNAKDQTKPAAVVATGTNAADGTITFTGIEYTAEKLNNDVAAGLATVDRTGDSGDVYTYTYNVSEDATKNDQGISVIQGTQPITVKVTDNRKGQLSAEVVYPEGGMVFKNAYGTGADGTKVLALNGTKVLDVKSGNKAPDIAGKYTFELSGSEGAPMPAKTTATNDAAGNISFGEITYTMENVFGAPAAKPEQPAVAEDGADTADAKTAGATDAQAAEADAKADDAVAAEAEAKPAEDESAAKAAAADEPMVASAQRSKTFTYTVTETGSVAGVSNDPVATKTITVKVTDNGDGTLSVDKQAESAATDFTFTNTYSVKPSESTLTGEGGFTITKTLDGRELREGEFEFALASQAEDEQTVVTAKNDANGKVAFPAISFNAPGVYRYRLAEVDGGLGGVTYDTTVYDVTATVVDNGDGSLGVTWSVGKDGQPLEGKQIVFTNSYKAAGTSITFNAAKVLTGRDLKKGEFTFELRDANGKVLQTVKNGALTEGGYAPIAFDPITYDEPGTYDYRIVEVKGDAEGITYDETVFTYHVVVTDDGNGQLQVEWTVGETGAPVFQNVYVKPEDPKPADPAKPADPGNGGSGDKLIQTGDNALVGMFAAAFAGMAAIGAGFTARRKKK